MLVAPSICDVESLCTSNNLHFRSKHLKISLAWLRNVFTLFKFVCSYITKPTTPNDANFARDELRNFPTKFGVKSTTSFQLHNETAKFIANFRNFKRMETVCQKFCETHCNKTNRFHVAVCLFIDRSQKTSQCGKNICDTLGYASCATFLFLPHCDVICDLLLNRRTATWNLFVN